MTYDNDLIRDDDLRQQLEAARGKFGFWPLFSRSATPTGWLTSRKLPPSPP